MAAAGGGTSAAAGNGNGKHTSQLCTSNVAKYAVGQLFTSAAAGGACGRIVRLVADAGAAGPGTMTIERSGGGQGQAATSMQTSVQTSALTSTAASPGAGACRHCGTKLRFRAGNALPCFTCRRPQ